MDYSLSDLEKEILDRIDEEKESGNQRIEADWIAHSIMKAHQHIEGDDKHFYIVCSYRTVRETTRKVISEFRKGELEDDTQMVMEGFDYLQTYYVVPDGKDSDGKTNQVMVHVCAMTYEQLTKKAKEHQKVADAHIAHAGEILRFRDEKYSKAA